MQRQRLAVVLILSWGLISTIDVLQGFKLHSPVARLAPDDPEAGSPVNNAVESADRCRLRCAQLVDDFPFEVFAGSATPAQKSFRIHKRYRVFLI
jgi:hypothetical protein